MPNLLMSTIVLPIVWKFNFTNYELLQSKVLQTKTYQQITHSLSVSILFKSPLVSKVNRPHYAILLIYITKYTLSIVVIINIIEEIIKIRQLGQGQELEEIGHQKRYLRKQVH